MHQEELNKYRLSAPLGGFVSYISLIPLAGMSCFIISEVSYDWFACEGLNSKLTGGRMPGKECGGGGEEAGAGVSRCAPAVHCPGGLCCRESTVGLSSPWWCGGNKQEQEYKTEKQKWKEETFIGIEDQRGWKRGVYFFHLVDSCKGC